MTELAYDSHGNLIRRMDAQGRGLEYHYDAHHRLRSMTDPMGNRSQLERDEWGRVTVIIDAKKQQTCFAYQTQTGRPFHEPSHIRYADNSVVERKWNSEGLLVSQQDPTGQRTRYQYGPFDQLLAVTDPLGNTLKLNYDSLERLSVEYATPIVQFPKLSIIIFSLKIQHLPLCDHTHFRLSHTPIIRQPV